MSELVVIYECGLRIGSKYSSFMQSRNESEIDKYIETMKQCCDKGEIVKYEKQFNCVSTTPLIIRGEHE